MNAQSWSEIISGKNRTWQADLARIWLSVATVPYGIATDIRNLAYSGGALRVHGVPAPVISVGNLTVGGTGKTPTVAWLVQQLQAMGARPAILSRGYRALNDSENDEKLLLDSLCPGVPHQQQPNRIAGARHILSTSDANVIVLDDGFQHRRLHRDLDIVLIDVLNPWGYGWLLPRGLLRERMGHLSRADVVLLTRCDLVPEEQLLLLKKQISKWTSAPILSTRFSPTGLVNGRGETLPLEALSESRFFAFCGIGNPAGFRRTLMGLASVGDDQFMEFPDHHHYTPMDANRLALRAKRAGATWFVTTRKDLVKLPVEGIRGQPVWGLEIALSFMDSPSQLLQLLQLVLPQSG